MVNGKPDVIRGPGSRADDHRQIPKAGHGLLTCGLTAHLQAGAAELQRLLELLAHRKEREATRG